MKISATKSTATPFPALSAEMWTQLNDQVKGNYLGDIVDKSFK